MRKINNRAAPFGIEIVDILRSTFRSIEEVGSGPSGVLIFGPCISGEEGQTVAEAFLSFYDEGIIFRMRRVIV